MKTVIALIICGLSGLVYLAAFFVDSPSVNNLQDILNNWVIILGAFSFILGGLSILIVHAMNIRGRRENWPYSVVLVICLVGMVFFGIFVDFSATGLFQWVFRNVQNPMQATMFALLAFYVSSASYRAFRVKNFHATLLLVAALLVMIGTVPIGEKMWSQFPIIAQWILNVPSLAAQRALLIGSALGLVATGLKTLLGIERSWIG